MKYTLPLFAAALLGSACLAQAGVGYIKGADVEKGELELEYQLVTSFDDTKSKDNKRSHKLEGYYGLTDAWQIGAGAKMGRSAGDGTDLETLFIEGIYQFIEADEYGFDMAVLGEYVHAMEDGKADKLEAKLLFEKDWDNGFETKANLIFERQLGDYRASGIEFGSKLGTTYEISEHFAPGLEWQADYGRIDDMGSADDDQKHYAGPVAYGEIGHLGAGEVEYQIGYLFGVSDKAEDGVLRFLLEYEMEF